MPAALLAAPVAALLLQATPETLADLERAFDQTCNTRIYGQFDDMCAAMEAQVKSYRAQLRRRPHPAGPPAPPKVEAPAAPAEPPPASPPPAIPKG